MVIERVDKNMELDEQRKEQVIQYAADLYKLAFVGAGSFAAGWIASNSATRELVNSGVLIEGAPVVNVPEPVFWIMAPGIFFFIWTVFPWPGQGSGGLSM